MANLLPLSAAKVLQVPIILFTSLEHFPVVPVVPTDVITTRKPILVAYSALGCGTFYSIKTPYNDTKSTATKQIVPTTSDNFATGAEGNESNALCEAAESGVTDVVGITHASEGHSTPSSNMGAGSSMADGKMEEGSSTPENRTGDGSAVDESMAENDSSMNAEDSNTTAENSMLDDSSMSAGDTKMADTTSSADGNLGDGGTKENGNIATGDGVVPDNVTIKVEQADNGNSSTPGTQDNSGTLSPAELKRMKEAARKRKWRRSKQAVIKKDKSKPTACGCGRGAGQKAKDRKFCFPTDPSQRMRCDCYREGLGCSYNCRCVRCANPFGTCDEAKAKCPRPRPRATLRLRPKYKVQAIKSHVSAHSLESHKSAWSEVESLAFEHLLDLMAYTGLDPTKENIATEYEHLVRVANEEGLHHITSKAPAELSQQFDVVQKSMQTFENLYKKQTELNWFQGITEVCCMEVETS